MVGLQISPPYLEIKLSVASNISLKFGAQETVTVNQDTVYPWLIAIIFTTTVIVNLFSATVVGRKERTGINRMIMIDCIINVVNVGAFCLNASSWRLLGSSHLCAIWFSLRMTIASWNNLVPVAIAAQRYLLVCKAVACHNLGGEKIVWKLVHAVLVLLCLLCGAIFALEKDSSLGFLRCIGQEEKFWYLPMS